MTPTHESKGRVMKKSGDCSSNKPEMGCHSVKDGRKVQPFPSKGLLHQNLDLPLPLLASRIGQIRESTYSYVVRTVKLDQEQEMAAFAQHGSAPNFQGGILTLCTCKHQMRSRLSADQWQDNVWIAGFTSRTIYDGKHWLFYLAKVKSAHDSQANLWNRMEAGSRNKKAAHLHYLGDLFKPRTPEPSGDAVFSPSRYLMPENHVHQKHPGDNGWKKDINYQHAVTSRHAPLLVADPRLTFLWKEPMIFFARKKHCRDYHTWSSLQDLLGLLRGAS